MSGGRDILVIDDESVILEAARRILEAEGFTVDRAADEETARRKVDEIDYRVVLCDLMLPGVRGFELVGRIQERLPQTPVILITGFATLENEVNGFQHGVFVIIAEHQNGAMIEHMADTTRRTNFASKQMQISN